MRASRSRKSFLTALASLFALALLCPPATRAHDDDYEDDDGWYDDNGGDYDENGYYADDYYSDDGGWCTYDNCVHSAALPHFDMLDPYGAWRYVPAFGTHLWFPWVDRSWRPYYYGHWVRSSFGMTWVSHEPWGDIPHHYGHWVFVRPYGWGWVPGWEWAPAWVTWGVADGYIGWAPCPPPGYHYPHFRNYRSSVYVSWYGRHGAYGYHDSGLDFSFWIFVGSRDFCGRPVYEHALARPTALSLWKTKRIQPVGPRLDVASVERVSREKIRTVRLDRSKQTVNGRSIDVYAPRGQKEFIRSGSEAAKRTYLKPAGIERPQRPSSFEKSRVDRSQAVSRSTKEQRTSEARGESARPRSEAPARGEKVQRNEAPPRSEKVQRSEAPARSEKVQRSEAPARSEKKVQRSEAPARSDRVQRSEATVRSERVQRSEASSRSTKVQRSEASSRSTKVQRSEAPSRSTKVQRNEEPSRSDKAQKRSTSPESPRRPAS